MMKKILLSITLFTVIVSLAGCGGSGSGSSSEPIGVNPGIPSRVQLLDVQNVAQTNSSIDFRAKILDGNGNPVKNEPVTFTNLSLIGVINPQLVATTGGVGISAGGPVVVNTNSLGFATITLYSTTSGFATIQAEVDTGAGWVRDQRTVYFTTGSLNLLPSMTLEVDSNLNGIYDELDDFIILDDGNVVKIRATVYSGIGQLIVNSTVTFATDVPYRVGQDPEAKCSDKSDFCEIYFLDGNIRNTDGNGQALVDINVFPTSLRTYQSLFNVTASADNGAFKMVTLFLEPVLVDTVSVSANPTFVESGGSSTITAYVNTNAWTPVPDGTSVSFTHDSTVGGGIDPFAQTTDGIATATFTAPTLAEGDPDLVVTITATVAGVSGTTTVTVTAETGSLTIVPGAISIDGTAGGTASFTVSGGTPGYTITSSDPSLACNDAEPDGDCDALDSGVWTTATFTVTVPAGTPASSVTLDVFDSVGDSTSATLTITVAALTILPTNQSISASGIPAGGTVLVFNITGGSPPYTTTTLSPTTQICNDVGSDNCATGTGTWIGTPVSVTVPFGAVAGTETITVTDAAAGTANATVTITP